MTKKSDRQFTNEEKQIIRLNKEAKVVRWTIFAVIVLFITIIGIGGFKAYHYITGAVNEPVNAETKETINLEIPIGTTSSQIGELLEESNLIVDKRIFKYYIKFKNHSGFQAGTYELSQNMTMQEIIESLKTGKIIEEPIHRVTVPEGRDIEQIADIMAKKLNFTAEEFLDRASDVSYIKQLIATYPNVLTEAVLNEELKYALEGYLFAGTYEFYEENPSLEFVIEEMISRTNDIYNQHSGLVNDHNLSFHEILSLASIVEKESKASEDRPKVAQVFFNRIDSNMRLQSDITALYALGVHKTNVTYEDIEVDSPFNTYVSDGITPGPINSPSIESIEGVLNPEGEDFDYIYFYARPSGETFYTRTLDEHNAVVNQYRHEWRELEADNDNEE